MSYRIEMIDDLPRASVGVRNGIGETEILIHDNVLAALDADGDLLALDIGDTTMFGAPFDQAAAHRAVEWARDILAGNATA